MIEIINNQRKIKISTEDFQESAERIFESVSEAEGKTATVAFVSDRKMRELNKLFRGSDSTTDVLSFSFQSDKFENPDVFLDENNLGDIIISVEQAARQARENDLDLDTEIKQLILHGVLHLCGYDHETDSGVMNALELKLRDKLKIA